jgi:hypothetical protein
MDAGPETGRLIQPGAAAAVITGPSRTWLAEIVAAAPRQMRLCGRFRSLTRKGKQPNVIATAIARELSAFIWAINREVMAGR